LGRKDGKEAAKEICREKDEASQQTPRVGVLSGWGRAGRTRQEQLEKKDLVVSGRLEVIRGSPDGKNDLRHLSPDGKTRGGI